MQNLKKFPAPPSTAISKAYASRLFIYLRCGAGNFLRFCISLYRKLYREAIEHWFLSGKVQLYRYHPIPIPPFASIPLGGGIEGIHSPFLSKCGEWHILALDITIRDATRDVTYRS